MRVEPFDFTVPRNARNLHQPWWPHNIEANNAKLPTNLHPLQQGQDLNTGPINQKSSASLTSPGDSAAQVSLPQGFDSQQQDFQLWL